MLTEKEILDYLEADLKEELAAHPTWPDMWNRLGQIYAFQTQHERAIDCFRNAIKIKDTYIVPYTNLAFSLLALDRRHELTELLATVPADFNEEFFWTGPSGMIHYKLGNLEEAEKRLTFAVEHDVGIALWHHHRWILRTRLEQTEEAQADLRAALLICPTLATYIQDFGMHVGHITWSKLKNYFDHYEANRNMALVCQEIGMAYFAHEDYDQAKFYFEKAVRIDLYLSGYYTKLGQMHSFRGDDDAAMKAFRTAVHLYPRNVHANMLLATEYMLRDRADEALKIYDYLTKYFPHFADLRYNYGLLFSDTNQLDKAIEQFKISLDINPYYIAPHIGLAYNLKRINHFAQALEVYRGVLEHGMESADIYLQMAHIYWDMNNIEKACEFYAKAYEMDPEFPSILYFWGQCLKESGDIEQAIRKWVEYLENDPLGEFNIEVEHYLSEMSHS